MAISPWRARLRPASFRGATFHVEQGARSGGRRLALHEFPKRDNPYPEDMGRKGRVFPTAAYCVGPNYQTARDALIDALEREGAGTFVHPTLGSFLVKAGPYTCNERREQGGYCEFEMTFFEDGTAAAFSTEAATQAQVQTAAPATTAALTTSGDTKMNSITV